MKEEKRRTMDKRSSPSSPLFQIENLTMIRLDENDLSPDPFLPASVFCLMIPDRSLPSNSVAGCTNQCTTVITCYNHIGQYEDSLQMWESGVCSTPCWFGLPKGTIFNSQCRLLARMQRVTISQAGR